MKKILFCILLIFISLPVFSQEEETIFTGEVTHGGYGGPEIKFAKIYGESGILVGGKGGWIINHQFVIGGAGYGLVNPTEEYGRNINPIFSSLSKYNLSLGYGGIFIEYIFLPSKLIHANIQALFAWGGAEWRYNNGMYDYSYDYMNNNYNVFSSDNFFVVEPQINVELNVTGWMRINAGASYRIVNGLDLTTPKGNSIKNSDVGGISGTILFKFGAF